MLIRCLTIATNFDCLWMIMIVLMLICKRKGMKKSVFKCACLFMIGLVLFPCIDMISSFISFTSVDQFIYAYGIDTDYNHVVFGKESAMMPGNFLNMEFLVKTGDRWKRIEKSSSLIKIVQENDTNISGVEVKGYRVSDEDGVFLVIRDNLSETVDTKKIEDSEGTDFLTCGCSFDVLEQHVYYTYLKEIPKNYKVTFDDEVIEIDWKEFFGEIDV